MICGVCGGGVRGYRGTLHGRPIADWKHTDVPPGTAPHRPVLGTSVDRATLDRIHRPQVAQEPESEKKPKAVLVVQGPIGPDAYVDSQSITTMLKVADEERWARVGDVVLRELSDGGEQLVFRWRRRDLAAIGIWKRDDKDAWTFDEGYTLSKPGYNRVRSTSLKEWLQARDEECPECGLSSVTHRDEGECP